jgi:actin
VPIYEGHVLAYAVLSPQCCGRSSGRDLTEYMMHMLGERGYGFSSAAERGFVRDIKEKLAYVAADLEAEERKAADGSSGLERAYECTSGAILAIGGKVIAWQSLFKRAQIYIRLHVLFSAFK